MQTKPGPGGGPLQSSQMQAQAAHIGQAGPQRTVEFLDPACETCRAFYPIVKDILKQYPNDVRLVIRYAPFHAGSDQVVKLLEAGKTDLLDKFVSMRTRRAFKADRKSVV